MRRRKREALSGDEASPRLGRDIRTEDRKARAGLKSGVRITLDLHSNFISHGSVHQDYNAFKVFVGQRTEFPLLSQYGVGIQPGYEHFLSVSSSVVSTNNIRGLAPRDRNCYFSDEGSLLYYKSYTFSNCMFECSIKAAQAELQCSLWFLPHPTGMVICDPWAGFQFSAILESGGGDCAHCLPDCESVTLDITQNRQSPHTSHLTPHNQITRKLLMFVGLGSVSNISRGGLISFTQAKVLISIMGRLLVL